MKRYHEAFHFRDENGNVAGAYVYDTVKESGFPVNMDDFQKLVAGSEVMFLEYGNGKMVHKLNEEERRSLGKVPTCGESIQEYWDNDSWAEKRYFNLFAEGMLPAGVMPIVKLPIVGEMLQIGIYANPIKLNEVRRRFGEMGKGFRSVKILGQDTLVIPVPVMAFEAYRGSLKDNLHDCVFCFPPISQAVTNTQNVRKASFVNRLLHTEVSNSVPEDILQFFIGRNEEKLCLRNQVSNREAGQSGQHAGAEPTAKMSMF